MNKKVLLVIALFILAFAFVNAQEGCCEQLNDGSWCQMTTQDNCETTIAPTSCTSFSPCILGTCINQQKGTCMPNTPKGLCSDQGGLWDQRPKSEIPQCQRGCCTWGDSASFVTQVECNQIAFDYGVSIDFLSTVTNEFECYALAKPKEQGACVFHDEFGSVDCKRLSKEECNQIENGTFNSGFLCTAAFLGTTCSKSGETICDPDGKVYFTDSCGNKANVYDENMFSKNANSWNQEMEDYWTKMQEPKCSVTGPDSTCGSCNQIDSGTICSKYKNAQNMPSNSPQYGDYVCADMGCYYDTDEDGTEEYYQHGETWCAKSEGTYWNQNSYEDFGQGGIRVNGITGNFTDKNLFKILSNPNEYNLPGSRYYQLACIDGEVIINPCKDYRNEVCIEAQMSEETDNFRIATCRINDWRLCFSQTNQETCEKTPQMCKWIEGYKFDFSKVTTTTDLKMGNLDLSENTQGSCVPLFAPGFDFWQEGNDGISICSSAEVQENAVYETSAVFTSRNKFADRSTCAIDGSAEHEDAVERCFANCYLIPDYGKESPDGDYMSIENLFQIHLGGETPGQNFESYCISDRKGYYCAGKTGPVNGEEVECAQDSDERAPLPIFFTHEQWLTSIKERARSMGDCGYKAGAYWPLADINENLEIISVLFQKLDQDFEQKGKWGEQETEIIYRGDRYVANESGYRQ